MFKNMKVGTKIVGGFIVALVLTAMIGLVAIYNIRHVGEIVHQLAALEIPETSAVVETERRMWRTNMLSYDFDNKVDEQSKRQWFEELDRVLVAADSIIPIATALNHQDILRIANDVKGRIGGYRKTSEEYASLAMENNNILRQMESDMAVIGQHLFDFRVSQNERIQQAIATRDWDQVGSTTTTLNLANRAINDVAEIQMLVKAYMIEQRKETADTIFKDIDEILSLSKEAFAFSRTVDDTRKGETVREYTVKYRKLMEQWSANQAKQAELLKQSHALAMQIVDLTTEAAVQADKDAYVVGMSADSLASNTVKILMVLLTSAILLGAILAFFITRGITRPLNRVIEGLNEGAEQVASAASQVSSASQSLAEGASEQAASVEETSSSLEEMSSMTRQNADNANQADSLMKEANQVVSQANQSMSELIQSMQEISKASEETSKIIKTIDEIAFQTNLLALNAAVEAARAGEAGAGFAVVADEVRNLAMRAADAAKNTANLIEGTVKQVKEGGQLVAKTNDNFAAVAQSSSKVGELVAEIAAASSEQAQGIGQVNTAVNEVDKVTQQNAANAEESASAAEEMNAQAEQMKVFVGELMAMVGGSRNGNGTVAASKTRAKETRTPVHHHNGYHSLPARANGQKKPQGMKTVKPETGNGVVQKRSAEQTIPLDRDFQDF